MTSSDGSASLRVLVYPHDLHIGGSQINAIEIAARLNRLGHECILFGRPGPLVDMATDLGLEFIASPDPGRRPSLRVGKVIASLIRERSIDAVHGYEWPPAIEAWIAAGLAGAASAVGTVMSMAVAPFLPKTLPLVVGTEQIAAVERANGRPKVMMIEPPVDVEKNAPSLAAGKMFRERWGIPETGLCLVCVTRLAHELKLEGVLTAIRSIAKVNAEVPVCLVVVGDGPASDEVTDLARVVNSDFGREIVVLTGALSDPREAYAAADIILGMGGSALRGLAFGKPLIVQGEAGFWKLLTPESVDQFLWTGWYGVGTGSKYGEKNLRSQIEQVLVDPIRRANLGAYGRGLVEDRFGLDAAAERQIQFYRAAIDLPSAPVTKLTDAARASVGFARYTAAKRIARVRGKAAVDDFNSHPVALGGPSMRTVG